MAFKARNQLGQSHHAFTVTRDQGPFFCQVCDGGMALVKPKLRRRPHFRHRVESNCAWEPETPDHENAKLAVCDAINGLGLGTAEVEAPAGKWVADVLWTDGEHRVAFEIQRANYTWAKFNEKFIGYRDQNIAVVYLFIGSQFYQVDGTGDFRLKDVESRLLVGRPERRTSATAHGTRASVMEIHRLYSEEIGPAVGGYLRRRQNDTDSLVVREPVFYPVTTKGGSPSLVHAIELGKAVAALPDFLRAVHQTFLARPGTVFWRGIWFSRVDEAVWAYFFSALGMSYTYTGDAPGGSAKFEFRGRHRLVAWLGSGRPPCVPETAHELRLHDQPKLSRDFLFVGRVSNGPIDDEAILACYTRDTSAPVVDFGQFNQDFSGAISGLHDGGSPGGNMGSAIAVEAYDLWLDGRARFARGVSLPLCPPRFSGINGYPRLKLQGK